MKAMGITEAVHVSGGEIHDLWFAHSEDISQYNSKMICWYFDCISIFQFDSQPFLTFHFAFVNCPKISGKSGSRLQIPRVEGRKSYPAAWCQDGDLFQTEVGFLADFCCWRCFFFISSEGMRNTYLPTWRFQTPVFSFSSLSLGVEDFPS